MPLKELIMQSNKKNSRQSQKVILKVVDLLSVKGGTNGSGLDPTDRPNKTKK